MIRCFMPRFYILCCASCLTAPCFMLHFSVLYVASCVCRSMHAVCKFMLNSFSPVVMLFHASLFLVHCSYFAKPYLTAPGFTAPCFILCCSKLDTNPCFMLLHISCFSLLDASLWFLFSIYADPCFIQIHALPCFVLHAASCFSMLNIALGFVLLYA